ncbi:MAG: Gldg family protein [Clostridia bacterium]|nr:Gldg family protein [Clostridia bacterium]
MFKKSDNTKSGTSKLRNVIALKRNIYAIILSVIFIVATIGIIALSTYFADSYPLELDLTTNKQHSISDKNFDYIKKVDKKINLYVTITEEGYNSSTGTTNDLGYIVAKDKFVDFNQDNVKYYRQTVELLKKYANYNENIKLSFVDTYDSKAREITDRFTDYTWNVGDILVESTFKVDGKDVVRRAVVPFQETYTLEDESGMAAEIMNNQYYMMMYGQYATYGAGYGYTITENKIEMMISSAIYRVTSPDTPVFLVPTALSDEKTVQTALENTLEVNNFAVEYSDKVLSVLLDPKNYDKYDGIILSNCKADITENDRELLEKFLDNNGKKGKSLFYFAGTNAYNLTNLCGFLGDWGIGFGEGILYETSEGFHATGEPTMMSLESTESDYTKSADSLGKYYGDKNMVYMKQLWENSTTATYTRETEALLNTASFGMTTIMPLNADKGWKPAENAQLAKFVTAILSEDGDTVDNKLVSSYVIAFASSDFIGEDFATDTFANLNLVLDTANFATGNTDAPFNFVPKTIVNTSYNTTEAATKAIRIIFIAIVPIIVIAGGIFVWIRRIRK